MYMYILGINHCDLQYSTGILYHNLSLPAVIFIDISIYIYSLLSFQGRQKKNICKEDSMVGDNSTEESSIIPQVTTEDSMVGDNSMEECSIIPQETTEDSMVGDNIYGGEFDHSTGNHRVVHTVLTST